LTSAPDSKLILETTPGESLLKATPLTGAMVPTAVTSPCQTCFFDIPEPTDSGGGPDSSNALPMAMSEEICENLMKPSVPTSASRPTITNNILRALPGFRGALVVTMDARRCACGERHPIAIGYRGLKGRFREYLLTKLGDKAPYSCHNSKSGMPETHAKNPTPEP